MQTFLKYTKIVGDKTIVLFENSEHFAPKGKGLSREGRMVTYICKGNHNPITVTLNGKFKQNMENYYRGCQACKLPKKSKQKK